MSGCVSALGPERFIITCTRRTRSFNLQGKGKRLVASLRRLWLLTETIHGGFLRGKLCGAADATWKMKALNKSDFIAVFLWKNLFISSTSSQTPRLILEKLRHVNQCHVVERMRNDVSTSCCHCHSSQFSLWKPSAMCHVTSAGWMTSSVCRPVTSRLDGMLQKPHLTRCTKEE